MSNFGTGIVSSSLALWDAIDGYITSTTGWSVHDIVNLSATRRDKVYVSDGISGNEKIYLRVKTGAVDPHRNGRTLKTSAVGDGYTESVSFNLYQHWDSATGDGYGEIGVVGPRTFWAQGTTASMKTTDFSVSKFDNWAIESIADAPFSQSVDSSYGGFDGVKFWYLFGPTSHRYDCASGATTDLTAPAVALRGSCYTHDPSTDEQYIFGLTASGTSGQQFLRYTVSTDSWVGRADPPWGTASTGRATWDGYDTVYAARGNNTSDFGYFSISGNTWNSGPSLPSSMSLNSANLVYVPGEGATLNAIYATVGGGSTDFYRLDLAVDGSPSGGWVTLASSPIAFHPNGGSRTYYFGGDYILCNSRGATEQTFLRYHIPSNTWTDQFNNSSYYDLRTNYSLSSGHAVFPQNNQQFVPCKDGGSTQFWFFADADRVSIIVKDASNVYDFIYAGSIDSYYNDSFATTMSSLSSGYEKVVSVDDSSIFQVGQKVMIYDHDVSDGYDFARPIDSEVRKVANSEIVKIRSVGASSITLYKVLNTYSSGARIGVDLSHYGVSSFRNSEIQMMSCVPKSGASFVAEANPAVATSIKMHKFNCSVPDAITAASANDDRLGSYVIWPIVVSSKSSYAGSEVRGQLHGVYVVDDGGVAAAGDVITYQGNTYMLFSFDSDFYGEVRLFAFGPLA